MKKFFDSHHFIAEMVAVLVVLMVASAFATGHWQQKNNRFSGTAGETLAVGDVVCISGTDSKIYKAIANDATKRPAVGVIAKGGAALSTVEIVNDGIIAGMTSATAGARLYLSETAGAITATAPTNQQVLGFVMPMTVGTSVSTTYYIQPQINGSALPGY